MHALTHPPYHLIRPPQSSPTSWQEASAEAYLLEAGDDEMKTVGCYQLEGSGVQLFEAVDGDYFAILGLPLLPLLAALRARDAVVS